MNRLVAAILPRQVSQTPYGKMLFSPGWLSMGLHGARMLSRNPWVQSGGNSTDLIVDGQRKKNEFTSLGAPEEKIRIVGDPIHDDLHRCFLNREDVRANLLERFGFSGDRRLIAFAVPIYAEHGFMTMSEHLALLRDFAAAVAAVKQNVILSFQPKSDPRNYTFLTDEFGFRVSDVPLVQFLPACDMLLCGNSSTQDWAILCGLPTVNMDYVRINDNAFVDCPGTIHVNTSEQFIVALKDILSNYDRFAQNQMDAARGRALFDGRVWSRYMDFMDELAVRGMAQASVQKGAM